MGFLTRFFQGRNGTDQLNLCLLVVSLLINLIVRFFGGALLGNFALGLMFLALFRMLSRNIPKRQMENTWFMQKTAAFWQRFPQLSRPFGGYHSYQRPPQPKKDRKNFRYFKCPTCRQGLRAPKGKGKIKITCTKCYAVFYWQV